jgi:hypothetical protein
MLKTNHLQMPKGEWHNLHNLAVSIESAISSCSDDQFGSDVRMEIQGILERAQKKIQRVLDKNFAVKPNDFDKYEIETFNLVNGYEQKERFRYLKEAKKCAMKYFKQGDYVIVRVRKDHSNVWEIDRRNPKGYDPLKWQKVHL